MTAVLVVSLYFIALTAFLGLDILGKIPPTFYALVLAALGAVAAVIVVAGFPGSLPGGLSGALRLLGLAAGGAAAGAGLAAVKRMGRAARTREASGHQVLS